MQTHAEHQQDNTDLCKLTGERAIRDKPRSVGTYDHPSEEVTYNRRQPESLGDESQYQGGGEAASQCQDQFGFMHHDFCSIDETSVRGRPKPQSRTLTIKGQTLFLHP